MVTLLIAFRSFCKRTKSTDLLIIRADGGIRGRKTTKAGMPITRLRSLAKTHQKSWNFLEFHHGKKSSHHVVLVVSVEEGDAVGVEVDGVPLLETLLEAGDAPDGDH